MKNSLIYIVLIIPLIVMISCDKDFEEINKNPVGSTVCDPEYMLNNAIRSSIRTALNYEGPIVQQVLTLQPGTMQGGNFNVDWDPGLSALWNMMYTGPIKNIQDILYATKDDPVKTNIYNMSRIWKAYCFMILVDSYGNVPYFEAGLGYLDALYLPKYDNGDVIYNDILKELQEATDALDASKPLATTDLFYAGNIAKWKMLGNSILLRAAMRLTKVNPAKAKEYVIIATNPTRGGLIETPTNDAGIPATSNFTNPATGGFHGSERGNYYLTEPFVNHLKNTNDPRIKKIAVRYADPAKLLGQTGAEDTDPDHQIGMPYGYNGGNIVEAPDFPGILGAAFAYSQPNRRTIAGQLARCHYVTASQTLLLKSEAVYREYIAGDVVALYNAGVKAHMNSFKVIEPISEIPQAEQDAYLTENPFNLSTALEQINTQYWISAYLNFMEGWANFRRSDFPTLEPNPSPSADPSVVGGFIRRFGYPDREYSVNPANLQAAISLQGPDIMSTRVFWDVQ